MKSTSRLRSATDHRLGWFRLDRYDRLKTLKALGWFEQFAVRADCLQMVEFWDGLPDEITGGISFEPNVSKVVTMLREDPVLSLESLISCFGSLEPFLTLQNFCEADYRRELGVRPVSLREFYFHESLVPVALRAAARQELGPCPDYDPLIFNDSQRLKQFTARAETESLEVSRLSADGVAEVWLEPMYKHECVTWDKLLLEVDCAMPLSHLVKQFEDCIRQIQSHPPELDNETIREELADLFAYWIEFGFLPYLDLSLWARCQHVSIPNRVMADLIFRKSDETKGEESVRKVTGPKANKLMSSNSTAFRVLSAYAAAEKSNKKLFCTRA